MRHDRIFFVFSNFLLHLELIKTVVGIVCMRGFRAIEKSEILAQFFEKKIFSKKYDFYILACYFTHTNKREGFDH